MSQLLSYTLFNLRYEFWYGIVHKLSQTKIKIFDPTPPFVTTFQKATRPWPYLKFWTAYSNFSSFLQKLFSLVCIFRNNLRPSFPLEHFFGIKIQSFWRNFNSRHTGDSIQYVEEKDLSFPIDFIAERLKVFWFNKIWLGKFICIVELRLSVFRSVYNYFTAEWRKFCALIVMPAFGLYLRFGSLFRTSSGLSKLLIFNFTLKNLVLFKRLTLI